MTPLSPQQRAVAEQLIRDEWPKLERFFRTKVPQADVLELAQATCLAYVEKFDEARAAPRAYLWGIARYKVLQHWERFRGKKGEPFDSSQHSLHDVGPSLSSVVDRRNRVLAALQLLPADQQMAIELRYGEELSLEETAAAIDVSLATVKRYLAAAEETLRAELGGDVAVVVPAYRGA